MDRRNFIKCLGGTGLAMMGGDVFGKELSTESAIPSSKEQKLYKDGVHFNADGKLKIVQFTDIHYKMHKLDDSYETLVLMEHLLEKEQPDLVIYSGDLTDTKDALKALDDVLSLPIKRNIPFAAVFGNHDDSFEYSRPQLYDYIQKKKGALMPVRVSDEAPDYVLPIKAHDSDTIASLLYLMDSHAYTENKKIGGYDWIHSDQISWYRDTSRKFKEENGGKPVPSLVFFHIPLPEFREALKDDKNRIFGVKAEGISCPKINSGFFTAVKECEDVMGILVGHDHDNDFAVMYQDVLLAYGRYTGSNTAYNDIENGCRVIEMYEGKRKFDSYIHLGSDEIESRISYPETFVATFVNKINK